MADLTEIRLPGVGVRHEFTSTAGERVGVLTRHGGRREILLYNREDPDSCQTILRLSTNDTRTLAELLGAPQIGEVVASVQRIEGLAIDWLSVPEGSRFAGKTIGDGQFRSRTGASIVAVVRGDETLPGPGPELRFQAGDVLVAVATPEGLGQLRDMLGR